MSFIMYLESESILTLGSVKPARVHLCSTWWSPTRFPVLMAILSVIFSCASGDDPQFSQSSSNKINKYQIAYINISYMDRDSKTSFSVKKYEGKYGKTSIIASAGGVVLHSISAGNKSGTSATNNFGCTSYVNAKLPSEQWIALVERGECPFTDKIRVATREHNASAVVIYSDNAKSEAYEKEHINHDKALPSISIFISQAVGKDIAQLVEAGYLVHMNIIPGPEEDIRALQNNISKNSVLFVSISFIVLMIISLAWLVFYYIQRFRYSHAKERLARRLVCAAKKAIAKIPQRTVKVGDKELDSEFDQCAVCIEPYKAHDVIRILPCRHVFHKSCVDPWLLDQRSCPMCKLDILRAFGMQVGNSQESVHHDLEQAVTAAATQEPELSSSAEDTQTEEIKVLLVPHACLHFRAGPGHTPEEDEEDDASCSLLGARADSSDHHRTSSNSSDSSRSSSRNSRTDRADEVDSFGSERKTLVWNTDRSSQGWRSEEEDEEVVTDSSGGRASSRERTSRPGRLMRDEADHDAGSLKSSSLLSSPSSASLSEQLESSAQSLGAQRSRPVSSHYVQPASQEAASCQLASPKVEFQAVCARNDPHDPRDSPV